MYELEGLTAPVFTGDDVRGRRPVVLTTGLVGILAGLLIINRAGGAIVTIALLVFCALLAAGLVLQSRARKRVIAAVGWLGAIDFRLSQLASKG